MLAQQAQALEPDPMELRTAAMAERRAAASEDQATAGQVARRRWLRRVRRDASRSSASGAWAVHAPLR